MSGLRNVARVAMETTLLVHGVPRASARELAGRLAAIVQAQGATPTLVGVLAGRPIVGMSEQELGVLLSVQSVKKINTSNLGAAMHMGWHGATTVSATMELAAGAGVRVFATGGMGGVHPIDAGGFKLDISADLGAMARFPVAVVSSGVKSILDVASTREMLETLGVVVAGFQTDDFPAFYLRRAPGGVSGVDVRFDDVRELARFARKEMMRTGRGVLVCNPVPAAHEIEEASWNAWLAAARQRVDSGTAAAGAAGRDVTPALLAALHEVSGGATLRANIALVEDNARVAGQLARALEEV